MLRSRQAPHRRVRKVSLCRNGWMISDRMRLVPWQTSSEVVHEGVQGVRGVRGEQSDTTLSVVGKKAENSSCSSLFSWL